MVDGVIGEKCNDNKGVWLTALEGNDKKCSNSTSGEIVDCKCVNNGEKPQPSDPGSGSGEKPAFGPGSSQKPTTPSQNTNGATNGRVIGQKCIPEDINKLKPYGWESGTYIQVSEKANSTTLLKARCETRSGRGDSVPCNCKATKCDASNGYDANPDANGLCAKNKVECTGFCYWYKGKSEGYGCGVDKESMWGVKIGDDLIEGGSFCSTSRNSRKDVNRINCWCFIGNPSNSVYAGPYLNENTCEQSCAYGCATSVCDNDYSIGTKLNVY